MFMINNDFLISRISTQPVFDTYTHVDIHSLTTRPICETSFLPGPIIFLYHVRLNFLSNNQIQLSRGHHSKNPDILSVELNPRRNQFVIQVSNEAENRTTAKYQEDI